MKIKCQILVTLLVAGFTTAHHIVAECQHIQSGVTNLNQDPLRATLYTQAYRNTAGNTDSGVKCCRFIGTHTNTVPNGLDVQCTLINASTNHICRLNYTLSQVNPGTYANGQRSQTETVISVEPYGIFTYSCQPSKGINVIRLSTTTQNPTNIPWDEVAQKFQSLGYPGYQTLNQSSTECINY